MRFIEFLNEQSSVNEDWKTATAALGAAGAIAAGGMYSTLQQNRNDARAPVIRAQPTVSVEDDPFVIPFNTKKQTPPSVTNKKAADNEWKFHPDYPPNDVERAFRKYAIDSGIKGTELQALLAQARHETQRFNNMIEDTNGKKYDIDFNPHAAARLGNTEPGDGPRFIGRGPLQVTGRWNYEKIAQIIGKPIDKNPQLLNDLKTGFEASIAYWKLRTQKRITDFSNTKAVTKTINPGLSGLKDRTSYFHDQPTEEESRLKAERDEIKERWRKKPGDYQTPRTKYRLR